MPNVPVSVTLWFDAKHNPPPPLGQGKEYVTDQGVAHRIAIGGGRVEWLSRSTIPGRLTRPQPSVWCEPSPPDTNDPLTVEDLRDVYILATLTEDLDDEEHALLARLRRALDAVGAKP